MRRCLFTLLLCVWVLVQLPVMGQQNPPETRAPRLTVILVVDQLRSDYLEIHRQHWRAGFRRLLAEGAVFEHAEYPYLNTVTCAGHATIATGTFPRTHGMTLNEWYDRTRRSTITCTDDGDSPVVSYAREARGGTSGKLLLVPTLADALRDERPGTRVVTLSLKARSAIELAGHGGNAVTWVNDGAASFVTSRAFSATPVPAVAEFLKRNPYEADATKSWTLRDDPGTYKYVDSSVGARPQSGRTGLFPHRVGAQTGDGRFFPLWQASPYSDTYLGHMAAALVDSFELGQRNDTDFLGVGFSALDLVGHAFGPESREVEDVLRRLDDTVGALMDHLDARVGRGNWVLGFSSDHGVAPIPTASAGGRIVSGDIRERVEETLMSRWGAPAEPGGYVAAVTASYIYFTPGVFDRLKEDPATYAELERALLGVPGVARVFRQDRLSDATSDRELRAAALSHVMGRSGDLILVGKPYWVFGPRGEGNATTHGTSHPYDRQVPVIMMGGGIKPGRNAQPASPADIAPTLAHVVHVKLPRAEGRVLKEALR